jgi:hypothetical protein
MLRELQISNFRGLREFAMSGLGRVNLLVGTNNCGKTSVLEAIHVLSSPGEARPLWLAQLRRGELIDSRIIQADVAHLVYGHQLVPGHGFSVVGDASHGRQSLAVSFIALDHGTKDFEDAVDREDPTSPDLLAPMSMQLEWSGDRGTTSVPLPISGQGGLSYRRTTTFVSPGETRRPAWFVAAEGLVREDIVPMFEAIVLTPDETAVLQALRTVEPGIERIASIGSHAQGSGVVRGGLVMMVAGQRIPIGSMGDGVWRMLGIALALVRARGGVLLVDEIDAGLHYSVLVDMWRLVHATANALDVQVFATTHSRDCYEALAVVTEADRSEISLQRIERGKTSAVSFSEAEIRQAAERGLEVR